MNKSSKIIIYSLEELVSQGTISILSISLKYLIYILYA